LKAQVAHKQKILKDAIKQTNKAKNGINEEMKSFYVSDMD
jgi:hypothetical protein